ncbi:MAG: non-canonical purine NTP pyrophosphatase [Candidatus Pacearchaeota archaeon]|jgi:hypothetical protein
MKVYFASSNKSKIERMKKIFSIVNPEIVVKRVPELVDVEENGRNVLENSLQKVLPYKDKYNCPVISGDTAIFFGGEDFDPTHIKRICLNGEDESKLTQKEIAEKFKNFYVSLAKKYGGRKDFYFEDGWSVLFPDGEIKQIRYKREYVLTDKLQGELNVYFPLRSFYLVKVTGKNVFEQTEEDWLEEFKPQIEGFGKLFEKF